MPELPDGLYPFIDERLPLTELVMVEARTILKRFSNRKPLPMASRSFETPVELQCSSAEYSDATFLVFGRMAPTAFTCLSQKIRPGSRLIGIEQIQFALNLDRA